MNTIMCYSAKMPDETEYFAVAVDLPQYKKYISKDIADWIKRGAIVEHVPLEVANDFLKKYIAR